MKKSVKELRRIAMEKAVNTNHCIEKRELVNAICNAEEQHIKSEEITISPETIQIISDSSDHSSLCDSHMSANGQPLTEYSSDDYSEIGSSRRTHRKSNNPNCRKSKSALWHGVDIINVQHLPYDIDGLVAYRLAFNPKQGMQSSKDGRHWATWVTSNRKGFKGIRRSTRCNRGYRCENPNCTFLSG